MTYEAVKRVDDEGPEPAPEQERERGEEQEGEDEHRTEQDHDRDGNLRPDHLRPGQAEEGDEAECKRRALSQPDERGEERAHAPVTIETMLPLDHAASSRAANAWMSAVISVYPTEATSEVNRFWSQNPRPRPWPESELGARDRDRAVVEKSAGNHDPEHEPHERLRLERPLNAILRPVQATITASRPSQSWSPRACTTDALPPTVSCVMSGEFLKSWS